VPRGRAHRDGTPSGGARQREHRDSAEQKDAPDPAKGGMESTMIFIAGTEDPQQR